MTIGDVTGLLPCVTSQVSHKNEFWILFPKMTLSNIPKILPIWVKSELTAVFLINACWYFTWDFFRFRLNWTIFSGTSSESSLLHIFATNRALKSKIVFIGLKNHNFVVHRFLSGVRWTGRVVLGQPWFLPVSKKTIQPIELGKYQRMFQSSHYKHIDYTHLNH